METSIGSTVEPPKKLRGWLLVFLFIVILGSTGRILFGVRDVWPVISASEGELIGKVFVAVFFLVYYWVIAWFGARTIIAFARFSPYAVSIGKIYLLGTLLADMALIGVEAGAIALTDGDFSQFSYGWQDIWRSLFFFSIWYSYLGNSRQVARLIPPDTRMTRGIDLALLVGTIAMISILGGLGMFVDTLPEDAPTIDGVPETTGS